MKRSLIFLFIAILLIVLTGIGTYSWWEANSASVSDDERQVDFLILRGRTATQIGEKLFEEELIRSTLAFKFYVQVTGKAKKIQAGRFRLSPSMNLIELVDRLGKGPVEFWVTIPEGLRREEIVDKITESLEMSLSQAAVFQQEFLDQSEGKEGFLFPDTYLFPRDVSASVAVGKLESTFQQKAKSIEGEIASNRYTLGELVTLASIIERETKKDEERPIVAGILLKRLETPGWYLQADATNQYAVGNENCKQVTHQAGGCEWWSILTKEDLEIDSPYNSYKYKPLPPTPIANPGFSSLSAAINPQKSEYWYYIHDPEGNIHYAKTLSEHNSNVRAYLDK